MKATIQNRYYKILKRYLNSHQHPVFNTNPCPPHREILTACIEMLGLERLETAKQNLMRCVDAINLIPITPVSAPTAPPLPPPKTTKTKAPKKPHTRATSFDFLRSMAWKRLRYAAIKKYGTDCMLCGAGRKDGRIINVDHIKPRKHYPELALDINNLQILCSTCNAGKGNWDATDWRIKTPAPAPSRGSE